MPERTIVELTVPAAEAELAADELWQAGPSAVAEVDLGDGLVRLTADVERPGDLGERWPVQVLQVDGDAYLDAWRSWARPVRAGQHVVLQPPWVPPPLPAGAGDVVVPIDPGRAFGSGSHPATRLAVAAIEGHLAPGAEVLDVGCGSGVLAVVALRLGATRAVAVDIDAAAIEASRANAAANGVADRLVASTTPLAEVGGSFDLVVANIGLRVLVELAPRIVERTRPGGLLVLSGLLAAQVDEVLAAYPTCTERTRLAEDGWAAPVLVRTGPTGPAAGG